MSHKQNISLKGIKELPRVNSAWDPVEDPKSQPKFYWISFIIKRKFWGEIIHFFIIPKRKWKSSFLYQCLPLRYSYSRLAWLYIHIRSWHNKWGPVSQGGGAMSYTTLSTWGRGNEGDTKLNIFTFDLFALCINIGLRIQWFHVFFFHF